MPVINEDIHRPLTVVAVATEPSATTSHATAASVAGKLKESSSSTASLNKLLTGGRGGGGGGSQCAITMKQSQSMTSLLVPTTVSLQTSSSVTTSTLAGQTAALATAATSATTTSHGGDSGSEMIQARLRAERPYNSLKKKRGDADNCNLWRRSWESHSSYSLNGGGSSNGKDDFWAALQPNYNYIMDTNLIDSCREAHGEIVEFLSMQETRDSSLNSCFEKTTSPESHGSNLDPRRLRRWLREMENCILKSPTLTQAMRLKVADLQKLYEEHTELYCKIESQARVVGACIRSAEKEINERQQQQQLQQDAEVNDEQNLNSIESTSSSQQHQSAHKRSSSVASATTNLKGLEKRYHLLYLKAFEIQCMLESLLHKKEEQSPDSASDKSLSDTDEEPAAKHRRLSPATELSFRFGVQRGSQEIFHFYGEATEECYDLAEEAPSRGLRRCHSRISPPKRVNGSDADSEGSDCEKENQIQSVIIDQNRPPPAPPTSLSSTPLGSISLEPTKWPFGDAANQMRQPTTTTTDHVDGGATLAPLKMRMTIEEDRGTAAAGVQQQQLLLEPAIGDGVQQLEPKKEMAPQQRTPQKRLRSVAVDSSKFNRSARKSKNCATFYFKHLDTDGENQIGGFSSQNDEEDDEEIVLDSRDLKSNEGDLEEDEEAVATSEEDDEEWLFTNNKFNSTVNADGALPSEDSLGQCTIPQISISEDSVFERAGPGQGDDDAKATMIVHRSVAVLNGKSHNGNGHSSFNQKPCSKESIHQLVLNAENLVREEVFLQQKIQQQQLTLSRRHQSHPQQQHQKHYHRQSSSPVLTTNPPSAKCNGGSNYYRSDVVYTATTAMNSAKTTTTATPPSTKKSANSGSSSSGTSARKCDQLKIKLVQEWLEQQPQETEPLAMFSNPATDCEASGEYTTESDCAQPDSDSSSEGVTDSVATCCLQGASSVGIGSTSRGTSTEIIGGSADLLSTPACDEEDGAGGAAAQLHARDEVGDGLTPIQHSKVVMRNKRRNSERPWSVSSLSQLQKAVNRSSVTIGGSEAGGSSGQLFANFSISESALHTLSPSRTGTAKAHIKGSESRSSLKRRKYRMKRRSFGKRSDSGSEGGCVHRASTKTLSKSESFSGNVHGSATMITTNAATVVTVVRRQSITNSNGSGHKLNSRRAIDLNSSDKESGEDVAKLAKPAFKLGSVTNVYGATNLGPLAKLSNYNRDVVDKERSSLQKERQLTSQETAPEDLSSEQAWDNYQEKYNSENYSEGLDTEAAKRLLEFGDDDYRRHIDSQSDCCSSSLSAANNLDSLSPPRHRKFGMGFDNGAMAQHAVQVVPPGHCDSNTSNNSNTLRRRRALEFAEYERRRKNSDSSRKKFDDRRRSTESSHSYKYSPKHGSSDGSGRKKSSSVMQLKQRETASSGDALSSENDSTPEEDDLQIQSLLMTSRKDLERTQGLRMRSHRLEAEDYKNILAMCQDHISGMGSLIRGPTVTVLSPRRCQETRELLSSWESLAKWSESAFEAKRLQDEMLELKVVIEGYGRILLLESKEAIEFTIQEFQEEKVKLKSHRQTMLKLNSRVHSWVTRQENEFNLQQSQFAPTSATGSAADAAAATATDGQSELERASVDQSSAVVVAAGNGAESDSVSIGIVMDKGALDRELQLRLKDDVSDLYNSWDEAEARINGQLVVLTSALQTWTQLEVGLGEFTDGLGKYRTLYELKGVLDRGEVQLPSDTVMDVRQVSRLLTERIEAYQQTKPQDATLLHPSSAILYSLKSCSNGSLSDSGISDGGCGSDGGLSERERRLGSLRRLAKQLESNLAPGSAALETIYQRLEAAEEELKRLQELQETCREAVERLVRTSSPTGSAASTASVPLGHVEEEDLQQLMVNEETRVTMVVVGSDDGNAAGSESELTKSEEAVTPVKGNGSGNGKAKRSSPPSKRKNKKRTTSGSSSTNGKAQQQQQSQQQQQEKLQVKEIVEVNNKLKKEEIEIVPEKDIDTSKNGKEAAGGWSEEKVEDPDTDDIDLLLLNNYRNYKKGGYLLEDGIEELDDDERENILLVKDHDEGDEFDSDDNLDDESGSDTDEMAIDKNKKKGWTWRVARIAVPLQFALISLFCVARLFEPQCCDVVNNFSMSFTPHLRYVRGPPPM